MTLASYILGFALGQLIYGPMADGFRHRGPGGARRYAGVCRRRGGVSLANTIDQLIVMRFFHGLAAAAASVVINALMRDIYRKKSFSRMMSFVMLVTTIAPLMAPIVGGWVLVSLAPLALHLLDPGISGDSGFGNDFFLIKETLPPEHRQPFSHSYHYW
ncbi:MFS transporter [Escherichia coli]